MTAFDAHLRPQGEVTAWGGAVAMLRAHPGVVIMTILAAATIVFLAFLALIAGQEVEFNARRAANEIQASILLRPQTSRAAAEALKEQLDALPVIRNASLQTKEAALAALEANGLPSLSRANPLPDVWVVTLGLGRPGDATTSLSVRMAEARQSLARLPEVESVDVDAEWLATIDRWHAVSATGVRIGLLVLFPIVCLLLGSVFFLAGRGFAGAAVEADRVGAGSPTIVGILVGLASLLVSAALIAAATFGAQSVGLDWKPMADRAGQMSATSVAALGLSTLVLATLILALSIRKR